MSMRAVLSGKRMWHIENDDVFCAMKKLPDKCIHAAVLSPPYWALRSYLPNGSKLKKLEIGNEGFLEGYVGVMARLGKELLRVLRDDGTLWLNMGDTYADDTKWGGRTGGIHAKALHGSDIGRARRVTGKPRRSLCGIPWRTVFALEKVGFVLRADCIGNKLAPMPEQAPARPTRSHEYIFMLTKDARYFYDPIASSEEAVSRPHYTARVKKAEGTEELVRNNARFHKNIDCAVARRRMRTVWPWTPDRLKKDQHRTNHYAKFPIALPTRCLLASVSEHGCCASCGAPYRRSFRRQKIATRPGANAKAHVRREGDPYDQFSFSSHKDSQRCLIHYVTTGWKQTCRCRNARPLPCTVLDPFVGTGTTIVAANRFGCRSIGIELNPDSVKEARARIRYDLRTYERPPVEPVASAARKTR